MPARHKRTKQYLFAYVGLVLLFLISATVRVRSTADQLDSLLHGTERARAPIDLRDPESTIISVTEEAAAAGIQKGDVLTAVNGVPYTGMSDLFVPLHRAKRGDSLNLEVQRPSSGPTHNATVTLGASRSRPATNRDWVLAVVVGMMMPVLCQLLGFWVVAVRIRDPYAWLLLFVLLGFAQQSGTSGMTLFSYGDTFQLLGIIYHQSLANGWPISMMLFGLYFPERLVYDRRWPWAKWFLLGPLLAHLVLNVIIQTAQANHETVSLLIESKLQPLQRPLFAIVLIAIGFFFFGTGTKLGMTRNPDARRRLSLLLWGAMLSLTPLFLIVVKDFALNQPRFESSPEWLMLAVLLPLFLFPVTLAYLIIVQRAMDVRVVLRQSVQYLLATNSVKVLQVVLGFAVIFVAAILATDINVGNRPQRIQIIGLGVLGVFIVRRFADRLRSWIDRRFFRDAYNADLILSDLADKVRTIVETEPLLETVGRRIAESLHVKRVALLLPQGTGAFEPAYALGYPERPWVTIQENSATTDQLRRERHAQIYRDDEASWIYRPDISEDERMALHRLDSQLLLPLSLNQKLLGILSLGPKQSEAPFSSADLRLLQSVAMQTGLALENSRLAAAVASEVAQRERLNREIEIAREVQERLFPQELPEFNGIDYAGSCRPALGVGGDYYDFIRISDTELGIAIGDVSGKGIPAALLMAGLRASLRGQTIRREDDLATLMSNVNKLVYESSTSNRYATFFYAQYDSVSRKLTYVNAGHNPPLIFRKGSDVIRLETGGPVVGLLPSFPYQQDIVQLEAGDLLVAFTDGISEAMNALDEEWGEEQLVQCVRQCDGLPANEIMHRIVAAADMFVAGHKQHDDMTLIVAKLF